jgi:hypothetical protein
LPLRQIVLPIGQTDYRGADVSQAVCYMPDNRLRPLQRPVAGASVSSAGT